MNRATAVLVVDWETATGTQCAPRDAELIELQATVAALKQMIAKLRRDNTELERKNQAAVTVIAERSCRSPMR